MVLNDLLSFNFDNLVKSILHCKKMFMKLATGGNTVGT
jgi:hypothetical protein